MLQSLEKGQKHRIVLKTRGNDPWNVAVLVDGQEIIPEFDKRFSREERWNREEHPLDIWDRIHRYAREGKMPDAADTYRMKSFGLFSMGPDRETFMLRVKVPGNVLSSKQMQGLAQMARDIGGGYADITSRGNLQIRDIKPEHVIQALIALNDMGLTSRGAGADSIRNITATPICGIDRDEIYDVRQLTRDLHHLIVNKRDLYGLPRKFNIAFDNGGSMSVSVHTNDIGIVPVHIEDDAVLDAGVYFRVLLGGIPSHGGLGVDTGVLLKEDEVIDVIMAMVRAYAIHGNRSDRRHSRLRYLIEEWGIGRFVEETEHYLGKAIRRSPEHLPSFKPERRRHTHIGVHPQRQSALNYVGIVVPVGRLSVPQMEILAHLAETYGNGEFRLTIWQNLLLTNVPDENITLVKQHLIAVGLHYESSHMSGKIVACTGSSGCRLSNTNTKQHALALGKYLADKITLQDDISIYVAGCPNSCVRHHTADIGVVGTLAKGIAGNLVEAYHIYMGGSIDERTEIGQEVCLFVPYMELRPLIARTLDYFKDNRQSGESFTAFIKRHNRDDLRLAIKAHSSELPVSDASSVPKQPLKKKGVGC